MLRGMTNPGAGSTPAGQAGRGYPAYCGHAPPLSVNAPQSQGAVALPVSQQPTRRQYAAVSELCVVLHVQEMPCTLVWTRGYYAN